MRKVVGTTKQPSLCIHEWINFLCSALAFLLSLSCFPFSLPQSRRFFRWIGRQHLPCCYLPTQKESLSEVKWCTSLYKHLAPWGERRSIGEKKCSLHPLSSLSSSVLCYTDLPLGATRHLHVIKGLPTPTRRPKYKLYLYLGKVSIPQCRYTSIRSPKHPVFIFSYVNVQKYLLQNISYQLHHYAERPIFRAYIFFYLHLNKLSMQ